MQQGDKTIVSSEVGEQVSCIYLFCRVNMAVMSFTMDDISTNFPYVKMRGIRTALVCPEDASDVEVKYIF